MTSLENKARPVVASVVVPTIGRPRQLRQCLEALGRCEPRATEIIVVDQSRTSEVQKVVADFASIGARHVRCEGRGEAVARNLGLREASHELVLMIDDDSSVDPRWVQQAARHMAATPGALISGRVLAGGDAERVPSTIDDPLPRDYTGEVHCWKLFTNNAVGPRSILLEIGGFDERIRPVAVDNDLCYRWLRSGRTLRYEPELVVWHQDWRSEAEMRELSTRYGRGQGVFYAKHLSRGDMTMISFLARDLRMAAGSLALFWRPEERRKWGAHRRYMLGIASGLRGGRRIFRRPKPG